MNSTIRSVCHRQCQELDTFRLATFSGSTRAMKVIHCRSAPPNDPLRRGPPGAAVCVSSTRSATHGRRNSRNVKTLRLIQKPMTTVSSRRVWHKKECSRCIYNGCIDSCIIMIISCFESSQYQGSSALWRGPFAKPGHSHNFQRIQQIERIQSTIRKSRHWSGAIANGHNAL